MYLALKPGVRCGWAAWSPGETRPACGSFDMPTELGRAGMRMHGWLVELQQVHPFSSLAYEQPGGPSEVMGERQLAEIAMIFGVAAHIESYCECVGVTHRRVGLGAWRRTFLGKGAGEKTKTFETWMGARCQELGWFRPRNREERDACGLLDHLIALEGRFTPPWRAQGFVNLQVVGGTG